MPSKPETRKYPNLHKDYSASTNKVSQYIFDTYGRTQAEVIEIDLSVTITKRMTRSGLLKITSYMGIAMGEHVPIPKHIFEEALNKYNLYNNKPRTYKGIWTYNKRRKQFLFTKLEVTNG